MMLSNKYMTDAEVSGFIERLGTLLDAQHAFNIYEQDVVKSDGLEAEMNSVLALKITQNPEVDADDLAIEVLREASLDIAENSMGIDAVMRNNPKAVQEIANLTEDELNEAFKNLLNATVDLTKFVKNIDLKGRIQ